MASVLTESSSARPSLSCAKEEVEINCNGEPEHVHHTTEPVHPICVKRKDGRDDDPGGPSMVCSTSDLPCIDPKEMKVTNLDNNQVVMKTNAGNYPDFQKTAGHPAGGQFKHPDSKQQVEEEPVSLSKTSSLLREVHQLGEDRDICLQENITGNDVGTSSGLNAGDTHDGENDEPITYHVLENSTIVKFESTRQDRSTEDAVAEEVDGFDGRTITLVEDENNAGTFKIAEIGEDNTLRVINNDRFVVFQDESAIDDICQSANNNVEKSETQEEESSSRCISQSMNPVHADSMNIRETYPTPKTIGNNMSLYEDGRQVNLKRIKNSTSPRPYINEHNSTERVQAVQTYADTSIMRPLHAEPGIHMGQQHHSKNAGSYAGSGSAAHVNPHAQSWHYPSKRETSVHLQSQFKASDTPYQNLSNASGPVSVSSHQQNYAEYGPNSSSSSATSHGSYGGESSAVYPGYSPHPMTTWAATGHVSSGHADNLMTHPMPEGGGVGQKTGGSDYGHPHTAAPHLPPSSYMPPSAASYVGYSGDVGRPWRPAKMNDTGGDLHSGGQPSRDTMMYHHQQQHQHHHQPAQQHPPAHHHHGSHPAHGPVPVARPYPIYPTWEGMPTHPSQRHLRYMSAAVRGRNSARIHKNRLNAAAVPQNPQVPVNINSMASRCSAPVAINAALVGRPRKRSVSQVDVATTNKSSFQEVGTTTMFTGSSSSNSSGTVTKEPARKRPREQQQQQAPVSITSLGTVSSNVHTLKPGHIIAWYIDYLIHENEDRTQISRAFTLPVNLFHTDDFYFLDSLRKKIRFPSPKFLAWMQYHLPSLNAHAIDFREGRPSHDTNLQTSAGSQWGQQDWGWQNKSKRDIIHDVFFYFQHRKAASSEPHQYVSAGTRSKAQLVA